MKNVLEVSELLEPSDAGHMRCYAVSSRVNHVWNDDEECSRPVEAREEQGGPVRRLEKHMGEDKANMLESLRPPPPNYRERAGAGAPPYWVLSVRHLSEATVMPNRPASSGISPLELETSSAL